MAGKKQTEIQSPYRKIIQYGTKSHACGITLPAPWLRKNGLKPGDLIRLEEVVDLSSETATGLILRVVKDDI